MSTKPDPFGFGEAAEAVAEPTTPDTAGDDLDLSVFSNPTPRAVDRSVAEAARNSGIERGFNDKKTAQRPPATPAPTPAGSKRVSAGRRRRGSVAQPGTLSISGELSVLESFTRRARWERMTQAALLERMLERWEADNGPIDEDFD